jgi:hypothetical protein
MADKDVARSISSRSRAEASARRLENLLAILPPNLAIFSSPREFAELLGVRLKTVYGWLSSGKFDLVSKKVGKHRKILTIPALKQLFS